MYLLNPQLRKMQNQLNELSGKTVVIVTPANNFTPPYVCSLINTLRYCNKLNINVEFITHNGSHIGQLREILANEAVGVIPKYDFIFWIDSDITWNFSNFIDLLISPHKITSGLYLVSQDGNLSAIMPGASKENSSVTFLHKKDLNNFPKYVKTYAVGFGFLCIKNGVFEQMEKPYFKNIRSELIDEFETSEDGAWCVNARRSGFEIVCNTKVVVGHCKQSVWTI